MDKSGKVNFFLRKGFLLEPAINEKLPESETALNDLINAFERLGVGPVITTTLLNENSSRLLTFIESEEGISFVKQFKAEVGINKPKSKPESDFSLTPYFEKPRKVGVNDFITYFRERLFTLRQSLEANGNRLQNLTQVGKAGFVDRFSLIGLVSEKRETKNRNLLLTIEDESGSAKVVIPRNNPELFKAANDIVLDEVVGVSCRRLSKELFLANELVFPDLPERKIRTGKGVVAFVADLHTGSRKFLADTFKKAVNWLNGRLGSAEERKLAKRVSHLFVLGDICDGIGVYPGQFEELELRDIEDQYKLAASLFSQLREDLQVVIAPGNHDAVRLSEPQPPLAKHAESLLKLQNTLMTTNPFKATFGKVSIYCYHGYSLDYYVREVDSLRQRNAYTKPSLLAKFLLRKRHLAPSHTSTLYLPTQHDCLLLKEIPDVLVTAHIHKSDIGFYKGTLTLSCSCFQDRTALQDRMGHEPDPGKLALLDLSTMKASFVDFTHF